jgi:hypothetical protein
MIRIRLWAATPLDGIEASCLCRSKLSVQLDIAVRCLLTTPHST